MANLPRTAAAAGTGAVHELGSRGLADPRTHGILNELPFQQGWTAGVVATAPRSGSSRTSTG